MDRMIKFISMLIFEIPAILLSIVIFAYFAMNRQARSKLKNHGWLVLLISNFIQLILDLPMPMSYFHSGGVWPESNAYCVWWTWCDFSLNAIGLFLMAWISLERHIIIFCPHAILQVPWKKWIFHFIPIILCLIWTPIFYLVIVVISPFCTNEWDFNVLICGAPCYFTANFLGPFDFIFNLAFPVMIIMFANLTLIIRVIYEKISRQQTINWRRHRKMVLQLWIVSSLYMGFWLPFTITQLIQITVMPSFMIDQVETMLFFVYFIPLLLPMICLSALPELVKKISNMIALSQANVIGVVTFNRGAGQAVPIANGR
jgi:hypothetical protein